MHNHPSGDPTPSDDDLKITNEWSTWNGVRHTGFDHVIVGRTKVRKSARYLSRVVYLWVVRTEAKGRVGTVRGSTITSAGTSGLT